MTRKSGTVTNLEIAELLRRLAGVLALEGEDRFKIKAYRRAAATVAELESDIVTLVKNGEDLTAYPGIGKAIGAKIEEIVKTGRLARLERSVSELSPELVELASRPALDPKKVFRIYKKLGLKNLADLKRALESGAVGKSLGARMEYHVRQGLLDRPRMLLYDAERLAPAVEKFLHGMKDVQAVSRAGSLRRKKDTVGDLHFLVASKSADVLFTQFAKSPLVKKLVKKEKDSALFELHSGAHVRLAWTAMPEWGLALLRHTGSPGHLDELEKHAAKKKQTLTARSLSTAERADESAIYRKLGLEPIDPELREGAGEVALAVSGKAVKLVELSDIRGDLHMHTTASDGANSIAEMAEAAQARGYEYIAISDHSQSLKLTNGLTEKRLLAQVAAIDKLNSRLKNFVILKSSEVDILGDGSLDYPKSVLRELDLCICSIHSRFGLNREQQTKRLLKAMDNRYCNILGPEPGSTRLIQSGCDKTELANAVCIGIHRNLHAAHLREPRVLIREIEPIGA